MGLGDTQAAAVGVWQDCTTVEWTVATPEMSLEIGVIGPFEEGFLNEQIGDRTFNVAVSGVKNAHAGQSAGSFNPPQPGPNGPTVSWAGVSLQPIDPICPPRVQSEGSSTATTTGISSPLVSRAALPASVACAAPCTL